MSKSTRKFWTKQTLSPHKLDALLATDAQQKEDPAALERQKQLAQEKESKQRRQERIDDFAHQFSCSSYIAEQLIDLPWLQNVASKIWSSQTRIVEINPHAIKSPHHVRNLFNGDNPVEIVVAPTHCPPKVQRNRAALLITGKGDYAFWPIKPSFDVTQNGGSPRPCQWFYSVDSAMRKIASELKFSPLPQQKSDKGGRGGKRMAEIDFNY